MQPFMIGENDHPLAGSNLRDEPSWIFAINVETARQVQGTGRLLAMGGTFVIPFEAVS